VVEPICTYDAFVATALRWVTGHRLPNADPLDRIEATTDLFATGILDSLAFTELVCFLEECFGRAPDLLSLEPDVFATVSGLSGAFGLAETEE
jgi:acyl carrier protein